MVTSPDLDMAESQDERGARVDTMAHGQVPASAHDSSFRGVGPSQDYHPGCHGPGGRTQWHSDGPDAIHGPRFLYTKNARSNQPDQSAPRLQGLIYLHKTTPKFFFFTFLFIVYIYEPHTNSLLFLSISFSSYIYIYIHITHKKMFFFFSFSAEPTTFRAKPTRAAFPSRMPGGGYVTSRAASKYHLSRWKKPTKTYHVRYNNVFMIPRSQTLGEIEALIDDNNKVVKISGTYLTEGASHHRGICGQKLILSYVYGIKITPDIIDDEFQPGLR